MSVTCPTLVFSFAQGFSYLGQKVNNTNFIFNGGRPKVSFYKHLKKTNLKISLRQWPPLIWQGRVCEASGNYRQPSHPPDPQSPQHSGNFKTVKFGDTFFYF
jgi:hypothetical protein